MSCKYCLDSYAWAEYFDGTKKGLRVKEMLEKNEIVTSVLGMVKPLAYASFPSQRVPSEIEIVGASSIGPISVG